MGLYLGVIEVFMDVERNIYSRLVFIFYLDARLHAGEVASKVIS